MKQNTQAISWFLVGLCLALLAYSAYVAVSTKQAVRAEIETLSDDAMSVAEVLDRGGATPLVQTMVRDCAQSERQAFDRMLSNLASLSATELEELNTLFHACGDYFANVRTMVTYQLANTVDQITMLSAMPRPLQFGEEEVEKVTLWQQLVASEQERAALARKLVTVQKAIIDNLREGESADSLSVMAQLDEANEIRQALSLLGNKVDNIRAELATAS